MSTPSDESLDAALAEVVRLYPPLSNELIRRYVDEILRWNLQLGLISKKHPVAACRRLLLESAEFGEAVAQTIARASSGPPSDAPRVADVGSGAGFPGIVWRVLYPEWNLVLIERREKKATFLSQLVSGLRFQRLDVIAADARDVGHAERHHEAFDLVATMAVGDPARTAPQIEDLVRPGGVFATTVPEEAVLPSTCGTRLVLESDVRPQFGRYAWYRKRV